MSETKGIDNLLAEVLKFVESFLPGRDKELPYRIEDALYDEFSYATALVCMQFAISSNLNGKKALASITQHCQAWQSHPVSLIEKGERTLVAEFVISTAKCCQEHLMDMKEFEHTKSLLANARKPWHAGIFNSSSKALAYYHDKQKITAGQTIEELMSWANVIKPRINLPLIEFMSTLTKQHVDTRPRLNST